MWKIRHLHRANRLKFFLLNNVYDAMEYRDTYIFPLVLLDIRKYLIFLLILLKKYRNNNDMMQQNLTNSSYIS